MKNEFNAMVQDTLFKLSDVYNKEEVHFDNAIGEALFGKLVINRVENIAYRNLCKNKEIELGVFQKYFEMIAEDMDSEYQMQMKKIKYLANILAGAQFKYAFLKGAYLIPYIYEKGLRRSNDIDILIDESDIDDCQRILEENGFVQGQIDENKVIPVTRNEIIMSRMNFGETIPFCKMEEDTTIIVDINFSLDYKPMENNKIIQQMLNNTRKYPFNNTYLQTLNPGDFIIHLCMHLYKEATTFDWVERRKDLNLYKFSDLNILFHEKVTEDIYKELSKKIIEYGVEGECYYALFYASKIYKNLEAIRGYKQLLEDIEPENLEYLKQIVDPIRKKVYFHNMSFEEWFACEDRVAYLKEA